MKRSWIFIIIAQLLASATLTAGPAEDVNTLSEQEAAAVAALLAKTAAQQAAAHMQQTQAAKEASEATAAASQTQQTPKEHDPNPDEQAASQTNEEEDSSEDKTAHATCLTVAYVDIDEAFNAHPRTIAVKEQIREKILIKENEVAQAKEDIEMRTRENALLSALVREIKPFYERIVVEPHPLLPKIEEPADSLVLGNILNRLTFAQTEVLSASPLNTPAQLEDILARIAENKIAITQQSFFIDNYKYKTREEILALEKQEVGEILQDIYREIKSFAKKRNIAAIVRKDEILYGDNPVNVTPDFINRLKKSKKYRKRGK